MGLRHVGSCQLMSRFVTIPMMSRLKLSIFDSHSQLYITEGSPTVTHAYIRSPGVTVMSALDKSHDYILIHQSIRMIWFSPSSLQKK